MELAIIRDRPPQQIRRVTRQPRLVTAVNNAGPATLTDDVQSALAKAYDQRLSFVAVLVQGKSGTRWVSFDVDERSLR